MIKANDVFCNECVKFIRVALKPTKSNRFVRESTDLHFCSFDCAKSYYDKLKAIEKMRGQHEGSK